MNRSSRHDTDTDLVAADWAVRRAEGLSAEERADFDRWLGEGAGNWRSYKESDRVWNELAGMDLRRLDPATAPRRRTGRMIGAIAASLLAAVVGYATVTSFPRDVYESGRGEVRTLRLADGSEVTLGADSEIAVRFDDAGRHVKLRRGEAMFEVRPDPTRPFDVRAADTEVTVLGTTFTVKAAPDAVRVNVIEGVVRVSKPQPPVIAALTGARRERKITRGQRVESRKGESLQPLPDADPAEAAPWAEGRLVYENASLAEVVADLNRYSAARIELGSRDLGELRVTGALSQEQAPQFLANLPATLPVRMERVGVGRVIIQPAS